ncbi:MAG: heavy metal-binding domain-containing protein, partial [Cyanobacteria bacterium J06636_28]
NTGSYERVFEKGQQDALKELQDRAQQLGANAIVGVQLKTDTINLDETGVLMLITASGTAVKI